MAESLAGRSALVTGASDGIGRAIAVALGDAGAVVWASARRADELGRLAAEAPTGRIRPLPGDLADRGHIAAIVEQVGRFGRLDVLVHAAAIYARAAVAELDDQEFDDMLAVNLLAPHGLTRSLLPLLSAQRGQVIFINSSVSQVPGAGPPAYAASKLALRGYADVLRHEVNPRGIKVCTFFLGRTATPLQERLHAIEGRAYHPERLIQPADVAGLVVSVLTLAATVELTDVSLRPMWPPLDQ